MSRHPQQHEQGQASCACPSGCPHATKAGCQTAEREALGKCCQIVGDKNPEQCARWAVVLYKSPLQQEAKPACSQHYQSMVDKEIVLARRTRDAAELNERIDAALRWHKDHPSVWDAPPVRTNGSRE